MRRFLVAIALIFGIVSFGATAAYSLPSGYTELQYIVTNNDAYIITDLMVNDFDRITSRLTMYDNTSDVAGNGHAVLFGSSTSTTAGSQQGKVFKLYDPSSCSNRGGMTAGYNNLWVGSWSNTALCKTTPLNTPIDVDVKIASGEQWIKIDGTTYGSNSQTAGTLNNSYPVTLFALNYAGVIKGIPHLACESVVFYSGNTMVRNLVPAKRNSDNAIGMYDTVSNTFFASSTSSPFIAGPVAGQSSTATISYVMNGGTNYSGAPTSYYIGVGATIDGTPTKSGNAFAGWCTDSALTNCAMTQTISTSDTGNKTFYAKWAERFNIEYVTNNGILAQSGGILPFGFSPVEYIGSNGTQYIDTGFTADSNTRVKLKAKFLSVADSQGCVFGSGVAYNNRSFELYTWNNALKFHYNSETQGANVVAGDMIEFDQNKNVVNYSVNGVVQNAVSMSTSTFTTPYSMLLFAQNHDGSVGKGKVQIYYTKVYDNGVLVRDYIPARRDSDGVCGMYDIENNVFYVSETNTALSCGPDVAPITYITGIGTTISMVPTRDGYEFFGWCTDSALTNCAMTQTIPANSTGNKTFYAKWAEIFNIEYVANGGDVYNTLSVPSDYTPVEYIETDGYSRIHTGITGLNSGSWEIYAKWMLTRTPRVSNSWIVGTYTTNDNYNSYSIRTAGQRSDVIYWNGGTKVSGGTGSMTAYPNQIHEATISSKAISIDGRTGSATTTGTAIAATTPIVVFARDTSGNNGGFIGRMYASWAKLGGVKKYDYVPVRRNSDGVCGMWDTVSQTFKPSNTTTNFTCPNTAISTPSRYTVGVGTTISNAPASRTGTFAGWCTDSALQNCAMAQTISSNATGNKTLYAKWNCNDGYHMDPNTHECVGNTITVNFLNGGHGTAPESTTCEYGKTVTMPAAISDASGYTFRGWKVNNRWLNAETKYMCTTEVLGVTTGTANVVADWYECMDPGDGTCQAEKFSITTIDLPADSDTTFTFKMSAKGTFYVDWGDGSDVQTISRTAVTSAGTYSHVYSPGGTSGDAPVSYTIRFGGVATGYATKEAENSDLGAIDFYRGTPTLIKSVSGSLGRLFPTLGSSNGQQPRFYSTFRGCTNLEAIPDGLFDGITGTPATWMFYYTFGSCSKITTLPADLFRSLTGVPVKSVFWGTFYGLPITSIPEDLFATISGAPAESAFQTTFYNCNRLTSIPENLFKNISGAPGAKAFQTTFSGCTGLTGSIPANLFSGLRGAPAVGVFNGTFKGCSGLTGSIPGSLFSGISGTPQDSMFKETFNNCTNLSSYVPPELFANISGAAANNMMQNIFAGSGLATTCPTGTSQYSTGFESYWSGKVACGPEVDPTSFGNEKFTVTVNMPANTAFKFAMSAKGDFHVDWGDGTSEDILRSTITETTYQHTYTTAGSYQIKFYGTATGYSTANVAAIRFFNGTRANDYSAPTASGTEQYITGISGSLGALFPTIGTGAANGQQPRFYQTFTGATNLTGSISANLFNGITGKPVSYMFHNTFSWCPGLTGSIPAGLFSGISGAPASGMFNATFYGASGLTGPIPETLFNGISGAPAANMFNGTFTGCSGLTGSIPANLFSGISGAPADAMFKNVFRDCTGLSGSIPGGLFGKIYGASKASMFQSAFENCTGLEGYIPWDLFSLVSTISSNGAATGYVNLTGNATDKFTNMVNGTNLATSCPSDALQYLSNIESFITPYVMCAPKTTIGEPKFTITTTELAAGDSFSFNTWQLGPIWVDWGDGTVRRYNRTGTMNNYSVGFSHTYANAGTYQIKLSGAATGYHSSDNANYPAVSFKNNTKVAGIDGNILGVFPRLGTGVAQYPRFRETFSGCTNLTGNLPDHLFGTTNFAASNNMFNGMFNGCTSLTGWIPPTMTENITSVNSNSMTNMFAGASGVGLVEECPTGYSQYITGYEQYWSSKVSCVPDTPVSELGNPKFTVTTTNLDADTTFKFKLSAAGDFYVDWGDGSAVQHIADPRTTAREYTHTYTTAGSYQIKFWGTATAYSTNDTVPTIRFSYGTFAQQYSIPTSSENELMIAGISGSLGALFPTIGTTQPRFYRTFAGATNLTGAIPATLFSGITGAPVSNMFFGTFVGCSGLTGAIPSGLFGGLSGAPQLDLFHTTFNGCSGLTGAIPPELFNGISGAPAQYMFYNTFQGCTGLTSLPSGLFSGISGAPAAQMYAGTFNGCTGLTGTIPNRFFGNLSGAGADYSFNSTFYGCSGLTGSIPDDLFRGITSASYSTTFNSTFSGCSGLSGYVSPLLFIDYTGANTSSMNNIFNGSGLLTACPTGTIQYTTGFESYWNSKVSCTDGFVTPFVLNDSDATTTSVPTTIYSKWGIGWCTNSSDCESMTMPEYMQLYIPQEYIYTSTSGPYIDTGYTFTNNGSAHVIIDAKVGTNGGYQRLSGVSSTFGGPAVGINSSNYIMAATSTDISSGVSGNSNTRYLYDLNVPAGTFVVKDVSNSNNVVVNMTGIQTTNVSGTKPTFKLLGYNSSATTVTTPYGYRYLYSAKLYDNGVLVRDYIPVKRKSDNKCGLYDMMNNTFVSSATSTDFSCSSGTWGDLPTSQLTTLPTKTGKTFNGYWTEENGTGTKVVDAEGNIISNETTTKLAKANDTSKTLYADWLDSYSVTYSCGDGTGTPPAAASATAKREFTPAENPCLREGYMFNGWTVSGTSTVKPIAPFTWNYTENKTFTASWTPAKFTITTIDMPANTTFSFKMSAKGEFRVDWGDGSPIETITRSSATSAGTYTHTYTTGGVKQIMFDGLATGYYSSSSYNSDAYSAISFYNNTNIAQVSGSLGSIFPSLSTTSTSESYQPRFMFTFNNCTNLTDIPSNLFSGITKPATGMFYYTFAETTSLYQIPSGLFSSIVGAPQPHMFRRTFNGSGITGSIPGDLFSGISGAPATYMFSGTFAACPGLTGQLSSDLFSGISGEAAEAMYDVTFAGSSGLTGPIPSGFFGNIWGSAKPYMFTGVFLGCSGLTGTIPENLFGSITSASTQEFRQAFQNCSKLEGWVPPRLFASVSGTGSLFMDEIFKGSGIVTECPSGYTQYITGFESYWNSKVSCTDGFMTPITLNDSSATTAADPGTMYLKYGFGFYSDADGLNSLNRLTTLPTKTDYIFDGYWTSSNGGGTQVIDNTGATIVNDTATKIAKITETGKTLYANWVKNYNVTYDCGEGTGTAPAAVVATSGKTFTPAANTCTREGYMFTGWAISGVSTGTNITNTMAPFTWNYTENKTFTAQWIEGPKFTITTTDMADNTSFYVGISAAGTFYIDWGDGKIQKITQSSTNSGVSSYSHTYATGGVKTINFAGLATGYYRYNSISTSYSPISFYNNTNIARLAGSLGAIFPTLSGTSSYTTNPRFMYTFSGCTNLTEIPATLFSGVTRPYNYTFYGTFQNCTGLTSIPATLFSNIQGAPAEYMFAQTFSGCTGLTSLPTGLFSGISGAPAGSMFRQTFENCSGLTGSIPSRFFGNLSGTMSGGSYYFNQTFNGCTNLSGYVPTDLFAGLSYASSSTNNILNNVFGGTDLETSCPVDMQQYITGFEDYFDGKVACTTAKTPNEMGDIKFTITTTNMTANSEFPVNIAAGGEFLIDCGNTINGEPQYIYITDGRTTQRTYTCEYPDAGSYQIRFYGLATGYDPNTYNYDYQYIPAIGFGNTARIAGIAGSLGALFPTIGNGTANGQQPRFNKTFYGATNLTGTIPENLFNGITGTPTTYMFYSTFSGCSGLTGTIPENLFSGLTGTFPDSNGYYFNGTFSNCSGLTGYIPPQLFRFPTTNVNNWNTMSSIFNGATGLLTACPAGTRKYTTGFESNWYLGSGNNYAVSCEPGIDENDAMFGIGTTELEQGDTFSFTMSAAGTFYVDWGDGTIDKIERNNTTPTTYSHTYEKTSYYTITFVNDGVTAYSSDLTTPAISFAGNTKIAAIRGSLAELMPTITVAGKPQQPRFYQTFKDCTNLEYIENFDRLFDRIDSQYHATKPIINGQPVSHMFEGLFMGCTALEAEIPEDLFATISGTPTIGLFAHTFEGCTSLYNEIPKDLFATISGAPAISMFEGTFKGCTGLEGNIPEKLFAGISGNPAERMFMETFDGCSNLEGYIYPNTFAEISTVNVANMMTNVFRGSGLDTECPSGMQQYTTGFEEWFTGKVSCDAHQPAEVPEMNYEVFFVELSNVTPGSTFSFDLSATGEFEVYWGDGNTDHIIRTNTTPTTYTHTYTENTNGFQIRFSSAVTGYSTDETTPAISFAHASNTSGIDSIDVEGSLMKLFPVLGTANGQIPRFYHTFYGLTNLDSVDWDMFNPNYLSNDDDPIITNLPFASHMFDGMFANCTNLGLNNYNESSSLFNNLFYYFDGTPAPYTFANMFSGTENLLGYISPYMFYNITGTATNMMQNIFAGSGIDTECPSGTNQYITGFESNWSGKVSCQTSDDLPSIYLYTTNMNAGSVFNFSLSATGRFAVNWGDGSDVQWIDRNNTTPTTYSHTYTSGGNYYVYIYGLATGYSTNETTAAISFANNTFIRSINEHQTGSLGLMFPTIGDGTTNGQQPRFYRMFYNCTNLNDSYVSFTGNSEWEGLSSGIHGTPASHMFDGLFENCTNMGTPSQDLFSRTENDYYGTAAPKYGISGAPAPYVFANTFKNTNISSFYPQWFSGLSGAPASHMFDSTFDGASNLYIYLGKNNNSSMFKNIVGAPAAYMFANTFRGTDMEGSPDGLFSGIRGAPSEGMFMGTFESTHISQIPEDLFAGVIGAPAAHMFDSTFAECQSLSDDYLSPALFVNISGTAAPYMFAGTFAGCNIGGNLPSMFAGITGSAAHMFEATFAGTNGLIGYIQPSMFAGITGTATDMMTDIFDESGIVTECPSGTTQYTTGFESWFDERVSCVPTAADFEIRAGIVTTTMPANSTFSFTMSAKGTFYVYWGDGSAVETITRNNTTQTTYSHTYTNASDQNGWRIAFGGVAIGYSTNDTTAAISFANNQYVAYPINIGHLFPTLGTGNGNQPRFYRTFYNCTNMVGDMKGLFTRCATPETVGGDGSSISTQKMASNRKRVASSGAHSTTTATRSASLKRQRATNDAYHNDDYDACTGIFDGVYGQPVSHMFDGTFEGCTGLTGEIPNSLFVTISGTPVPYVFANTFKNCTGISGEIPKDLFGGLYGAPAAHMFESTFENDTNLTGTIPTSLFSSRSVSSTTGSVSSGSGGDSGDIKKASIKRTAMVSRGAVLRREVDTPSESGGSDNITLTSGTFNGIEGAPAAYMFSKTFKGCANLTGAIPAALFGGISGAPAEYMFEETFAGCTGIDTIPACLFGGISGTPAAGMYKGTFDGCSNAEWEYTPGATHNISSVSTGTNIQQDAEFASNLKRGASLTRGAVAGSTLGKITNATKKVNTLREAVMGGLTRGGIIRSAGLRSNTTTTDNANAMPSLFGQFTGAAAAHMFENTFRGCAKLSGYVPPKMFEGITGVATDMMTDEFDNSGIATSCPAGYSTATTGFESWWDGRVACEYVGQICVYEEGSANPYKCADGCGWASKLMLYNESWNEFGGFPGYPLMSENVTDHSINISNGTTTCYLPIAENADWGLHVKWNDKVWHAMFAQMDADENGTWGYCTGTYQDNYDGSCTTNSDCDWLYDENYPPACYQGTCALYNSYGNCYYIMGDTDSQCISQSVA